MQCIGRLKVSFLRLFLCLCEQNIYLETVLVTPPLPYKTKSPQKNLFEASLFCMEVMR